MNQSNHRSTTASAAQIILCTLSLAIAVPQAIAAKPDKEDKGDKDLAIGTVASIEGDGIVVRSEKGKERTIHLTKDTSLKFVGFKGIKQTVNAPQKGFGVKASVGKGDLAKGVIFAPPIPELKKNPDRHKLTAVELFKLADQNKDERVDYVEYSTWIFQSYKHLPDRWGAKLDKNGDDTLDFAEFTSSLDELDWWKISRKSADEWVKIADKDKSGGLNLEEAKAVTGGAHGKHDQVFKKLDRDKSGELSAAELQPYVEYIINKKDGTE